MAKQKFINSIKDGAIKGYERYKILPSLIIAQAILESAWGKSPIDHNLFGIKAGSSWRGKVAIKSTKEYVNNKWITVDAKFRAYDSFFESMEDHAKLLGTLSRYRNLIDEQDYKTACRKIWQDGYATDPNYPNKLITIIEQNKLYEIDNEVLKSKATYRKGDKGKTVKEIQENLSKLGYKIGIDGVFGSETENAIKQFQKIANIRVDGIVGNDTLNQIEIFLNKASIHKLGRNNPNIQHVKY